MFYLWLRMKEEDRPRVWLLYGWVSGLACLGSCFGTVTWVAAMQYFIATFNRSFSSDLTAMAQATLHAQSARWNAVYYVAYPIEFMCLSVAKLLVLDRMANFAVAKGDGMSRRLAVGGRVVVAAVVLGNVLGLCAHFVAAAYWKEAADLYSAASAAYDDNNTDAGTLLSTQANGRLETGSEADSVQNFCEAVVLLIIIVAFAVVGIASARRVSSALRNTNDEHVRATGMQLRRQVVGTTAVVFVTFLLRAAFSIMYASSNALQNQGAACADFSGVCDSACFNVWQLMQTWIASTPELKLTVVLISSPLALLVALWGMTTGRTLQHMRSGSRRAPLLDRAEAQLK